MTRDQAPFIPPSPGAPPLAASPWRVFGTRAFFRLWLAQCLSSLGDWVGFFAILAIATRISGGSAAAVSLVVGVRMVPGFFLATVGGVIVDRFDRRKVMVVCDVGRAMLLVVLPFVDGLAGLVILSFSLEVLTLLWGPAKDASLPNLVPDEQLASANSLGLVAAYGTFPLAAAISSALAVLAHWLGAFDAVSALSLNREALALWVDALSFIASALLIWRLPLPKPERSGERRVDWTQTFREIVEGLRFIRSDRLVRAVMIGLAGGIIGAGAMVPLGAVFAEEVLGGSSQFFILMTGLGTGLAIGVATLLAVQRRVPRDTVFTTAVMGVGVFLVISASFSEVILAVLFIAAVGGFAGTAYITGFTLLQENVADELRGRTFATLYTIVRLCLLVSLTISPLFADLFDWLTELVLGPERTATIGGFSYAVPGVRVALWGGGLVTLASGILARFLVRRARRARRDGIDDDMSGSGVVVPRFIVLEGGDGSGKSTQSTLLVERLRASGVTVVETFEPGATALGAGIRALVLDAPDSSVGTAAPDPVAEALLMAADRAQHVSEVIVPALDRGAWVVCDRFVPSSLVYQGVARGLGVDAVAATNVWATGGLEPDVVIVLDVDDAVADARRGHSDRLEREAGDFHGAVRAAYRDLAGSRGWSLVDANSSVERTADAVWSVVVEATGV